MRFRATLAVYFEPSYLRIPGLQYTATSKGVATPGLGRPAVADVCSATSRAHDGPAIVVGLPSRHLTGLEIQHLSRPGYRPQE